MIVTDILEYDKKRVLIQLDGHLKFPLYIREVQQFHIVKDQELEDTTYNLLIDQILDKRIKLRAMNLLQKRTYSRAMLKRKLLDAHYPEFLVEKALDYVASYKYIDDMRYAQEYIRCYIESRSKRRILQELGRKGIMMELAEEAWNIYESENNPIDEETQIKELLRKKGYQGTNTEYKEAMKIMNYLYRKGYSVDSIKRCMNVEELY